MDLQSYSLSRDGLAVEFKEYVDIESALFEPYDNLTPSHRQIFYKIHQLKYFY